LWHHCLVDEGRPLFSEPESPVATRGHLKLRNPELVFAEIDSRIGAHKRAGGAGFGSTLQQIFPEVLLRAEEAKQTINISKLPDTLTEISILKQVSG
jgi:hypothetical protein